MFAVLYVHDVCTGAGVRAHKCIMYYVCLHVHSHVHVGGVYVHVEADDAYLPRSLGLCVTEVG